MRRWKSYAIFVAWQHTNEPDANKHRNAGFCERHLEQLHLEQMGGDHTIGCDGAKLCRSYSSAIRKPSERKKLTKSKVSARWNSICVQHNLALTTQAAMIRTMRCHLYSREARKPRERPTNGNRNTGDLDQRFKKVRVNHVGRCDDGNHVRFS